MAEFRCLRQELAAFFHERRVKVSLFLQDETQNNDGSIVIPLGGILPFAALGVTSVAIICLGGRLVKHGLFRLQAWFRVVEKVGYFSPSVDIDVAVMQ